MEIRNDEKLRQWLDTIEAAESTQKGYTMFMALFCECVGKTPSELIQESIDELKQGLLPAERRVGGYIAKFKKCMKDKGYAQKSFHIGISAVRSFYKAFDIPLPSSAVKTKKAMPLRENNFMLKREDIIKLVTNAPNLREKAIVLSMSTSGMGRQEIINLKVEDITFDDNNIGIMTVRREKAQIDFTTFISPEATLALRAYWEERNRLATSKESVTVEDLKKSKFAHAEETVANRKRIAVKLKVTPRSYAFVTYETGDKLSKSHFAGIFHSMAEKLGYDDGVGFIKTRSHGLRKFFASTLENVGMPKNKVDFMLGHTPSGNDLAYFHTDVGKLKELYKKFLPYLAFEKTIEVRSLDSRDAERLEILEKENRNLKVEMETMIKAMIEARVKEMMNKG